MLVLRTVARDEKRNPEGTLVGAVVVSLTCFKARLCAQPNFSSGTFTKHVV